jgi:hypothetical protein
MENEENMEPGFAKELKKFASYATLVIGALAWLDNRYMGSHKELLATMETHHSEVVALEKDVIKIDKDVEYLKLDLEKALSQNNKKDGTDRIPFRKHNPTASLFAIPPKDENGDERRKHYISAI